MTSDMILESDKRQSVSAAYVEDVIAANKRAKAEKRPDDVRPVPVAGVECPRDPKHGRMLMSAKNGMLECGPCGYQVVAPTD